MIEQGIYLWYSIDKKYFWSKPRLMGHYLSDSGKLHTDFLCALGNHVPNDEATEILEHIATEIWGLDPYVVNLYNN